jgi:glyoxylase-like metal-dependent hydrolase (beta-lactamase superfamily II)
LTEEEGAAHDAVMRPPYLVCLVGYFSLSLSAWTQINVVQEIAPGVYFHEGDLTNHGHCNNGWVIFKDYVLVIDANFPSGAKELIPKIRALTDKPIRFAFDTHHHGDHAYGNQVWADQGATPVAHVGVIEEMKKYETGLYGGAPGRWENEASRRADVAASKLLPPSLLFRKDLIFDDGTHRVELLHLGTAHTHGDGFAWLPKEQILFTGDACVNGPYNYVGDGDTGEWIKTMEAAKQLGATLVCPGHGPKADGDLLSQQQEYFVTLRKEVAAFSKDQQEKLQQAMGDLRTRLLKNERIAKFIGDSFPAQAEKVFTELGGKPFSSKSTAQLHRNQHAHAHAHGHGPIRHSTPDARR